MNFVLMTIVSSARYLYQGDGKGTAEQFKHRPVPRHLGTDGRVQEVYCVIAHPDHKVEHCKYNQEYNYSEK